MDHPEFPYLAAGAISIVGGVARDKKWPAEGTRALIATLILVIFASASAGTRLAPLVRALGLLTVLVATIAAVPAFNLTPASTLNKKKSVKKTHG